MRRAIPLISVCLLLAAAAEPAFAQQRLIALTSREIVEVDTNVSTLGQVKRRVPIPNRGLSDAVSVAGGGLLAWVSNFGVALYDTALGSVQQHMLPELAVDRILGADAASYQLVLLGSRESGARIVVFVADLRLGTTHLIDLGGATEVGPIAYANRADVLFVARPEGGLKPLTRIDVISAASGALLKTLSISPALVGDLAATSNGTRLFVDDLTGGLSVLDVVSGATLATNSAISGLRFRSMLIDERRGRVLIASAGTFEARLEAFAADTLVSLGRADLPRLDVPSNANPYPPFVVIKADVSARSATIFAHEALFVQLGYLGTACEQSTLAAIAADTGRVRRAVDLSATGIDCGVELVRLTEPGAPAGFNATATGNRVELTWAAEAATHYEVEAGTAPGLANLATIPVNDTRLVVDGVPPGTYHLRVRAINTIGKSAPSQDVQVVVP